MVKFGYGDIICNVCNQGIGIKTNIHRNTENWEKKIHSSECDHFKLWIDILTRKTYIPDLTEQKKVFFKGIDEIKIDLVAKCKNCEKELKSSSCCRNMNIGYKNFTEVCSCGNKVNFVYNYKTNSVPSYEENAALYLPNLNRINYRYK
jgi:hypothetical protein